MAKFFVSDRVNFMKKLLGFQFISLFALIFFYIFYLVVEFFKPDFFNITEWWVRTDSITESVFAFWPMYIWAFLWSMLAFFGFDGYMSNDENNELLFYDVSTSVMAGVWEEIGFRCLFIFTGMIGVWLANFFWSWMMIFMIIVVFIMSLGGLLKKSNILFIGGILVLSVYGLIYWCLSGITDPVYWCYENILFPIVNFFTAGYLRDIFYDRNVVSFLFIAGAISANAKFRDGHKYQGLIGYYNSWFIGCVMIYCLVHYGLAVCILSHAIYDLIFAVVHYFIREYKYRFAFS